MRRGLGVRGSEMEHRETCRWTRSVGYECVSSGSCIITIVIPGFGYLRVLLSSEGTPLCTHSNFGSEFGLSVHPQMSDERILRTRDLRGSSGQGRTSPTSVGSRGQSPGSVGTKGTGRGKRRL